MVGIEFNESKDRKVIDTWKTYLDHLQSYPQKDEGQQKIWADKKNDQLSDLLYEMSQSLGFDFDKVHIKKAGYTPQAYEDQELANNFIRHQLVDILLGKKHFPMSIEKFPVDDEALKVQKDLHVLMKEHFEGKRSIPVSIDNSER